MSTVSLFSGRCCENVYRHLLTLYGDDSVDSKRLSLSCLPDELRKKIFDDISKYFKKPLEFNFGEAHVFDSQPALNSVVKELTLDMFRQLDQDRKDAVACQIRKTFGLSDGQDRIWEKDQLTGNIRALLQAMDRLESPDQYISNILEAWVAEGGETEDRAQARHKIIDFFRFGKIHLCLRGLRLTSLPMIFDQKYDNQSAPLSRWASQLQKLQWLDLSNNCLESVPGDIQLPNLRRLNLSYNKLQSIPEEIGKCEHLVHLDVSNNRLDSISKEIRKCRELVYLNLSGNKLHLCKNFLDSIPEEI